VIFCEKEKYFVKKENILWKKENNLTIGELFSATPWNISKMDLGIYIFCFNRFFSYVHTAFFNVFFVFFAF